MINPINPTATLAQLRELNRLISVRAIGHTTVMLEGAFNTKSLIIVANQNQKDFIDDLLRNRLKPSESRTVSLHSLYRGPFMAPRPTVFDHYALQHVFWKAIETIEHLEKEISGLKEFFLLKTL